MKWKVGCDLNITEGRTMITQVRVMLVTGKMKLPLCTTWRCMSNGCIAPLIFTLCN